MNVEESHISAYFCQLKGEFDEKLNWPASVCFTLTLHNNRSKVTGSISEERVKWNLTDRVLPCPSLRPSVMDLFGIIQ